MKTIVFYIGKGGVGKTTISTHLAHSLREEGERVCFLDADGQMNGSMFLSPYVSDNLHCLDFFAGKLGEIPKQDLLCIKGDLKIFSLTDNYLENITKSKKQIEEAGYDYLIIDTNPAPNSSMLGSLMISDLIFAPIMIAEFSFRQAEKLVKIINSIKRNTGSKTKFAGIIPNMVAGVSKEQTSIVGELFAEYGDLMMPYLSNRTPINKAMGGTEPIWRVKPQMGNTRVATAEMIRLMKAMHEQISKLTKTKKEAQA